jgi:hypothetical protein
MGAKYAGEENIRTIPPCCRLDLASLSRTKRLALATARRKRMS